MEKITKRADGRYQIRIYLGSVNGKKQYKYVYALTQKEVKAKADGARAALGKGLDITARSNTFGQWFEYWLNHKSAVVSERQLSTLRSLGNHLEPLKGQKLDKINPVDVQQILNSKTYLSQKSLKEIMHVANGVFEYAIKNRVIDFNPAKYVDIPINAKAAETRRALSEDEQKAILNVSHRMQTPAMIMLLCGLRRGEVIPLTWSDVNFAERTITVNKSVTFLSNTPIVKPQTKTKAGMRTVIIPDALLCYLQSLKKDNRLVCPSSRGEMLTATMWKRGWDNYLKCINEYLGSMQFREPFTAHCLRHTYATNLVLAGVDVTTAKELLGHSSVQTTLDIYTHVTASHKKKNIDKFNDFFKAQIG